LQPASLSECNAHEIFILPGPGTEQDGQNPTSEIRSRLTFVEHPSVRRTLIQRVLPVSFCVVPLLAAVLVAAATPVEALQFYLQRVQVSYMDWLILGLGVTLFVVQLFMSWRALQWRGTGFDERPDRWLSNLAQAAEWFPMLGLIGTVAGILQTFSEVGRHAGPVEPNRIIALYAPAITATGSGLFMALVNILPTWTVLLGRDLILALGGGDRSAHEETLP
jgi:hypothetical protein